MQRWTVRLATLMPTFSNSPRIRSAPPQAIVGRHLFDQRDRLHRNLRFAGSRVRFSPPEEAEALAMPAQDRLRFDDDEGIFPASPSAGEHDKEGAVCRREARPFD